MRYLYFFLGYALSLFSTVNEPFRFELISGYRNDHLHWHLQDGGTGLLNYSELYQNIQFWENGLMIWTIQRDFVLSVRGSYGAFGRGEGSQDYRNLSFTVDQPEFEFCTNGWAADLSGYFGMAVNLTADRTYTAVLIPLIGCSGHFEQIHRKGVTPNPLESTDSLGADAFTMRSFFPKNLHSTWYGLFLGAGFLIEPGGKLTFRGGYSYHWLHVRFKTAYGYLASLFDQTLVGEQIAVFDFQTKQGSNLGQTGWGQIDYALSRPWKVGLGAQIHYFSTALLETHLHGEKDQILPASITSTFTQSQKLKVRWTCVVGWIMVSRTF